MLRVSNFLRKFSNGPPIALYQNIYASKPAPRNKRKMDNFKSYEQVGKIKQQIWREHSEEQGLGPIDRIDESAKIGDYKNPEYYSYHNFTYYDLEMAIKCMHLPQPSALDDHDLVEMTRKNCLEPVPVVEEGSFKCAPPNCPGECKPDSEGDGTQPGVKESQ